MMLAFDAVVLPIWLAILLLGAALFLVPLLANRIRGRAPKLAAGIDSADHFVVHEILIPAIKLGDTTGKVAALIEELADKHDKEDHPIVQKVTG